MKKCDSVRVAPFFWLEGEGLDASDQNRALLFMRHMTRSTCSSTVLVTSFILEFGGEVKAIS